jgi:hypothetical protein
MLEQSSSLRELAQITRSAMIFDNLANLLVQRVRTAMRVPSSADAETEQQFRALREKLDAFFPNFQRRYARLLADHLRDDPSRVVDGLRDAAIQRFFAASADIDRTMSVELQQLAGEMVQSVCSPAH